MTFQINNEADYQMILSLRNSADAAIQVYEGKEKPKIDLTQRERRQQVKQERLNRFAAHDLKYSKKKAS